MTNPFVWFHNGSEKPGEAVKFYEEFLGWKGSAGPAGMSMFSGDGGPFAGVATKDGAIQGWVPLFKSMTSTRPPSAPRS